MSDPEQLASQLELPAQASELYLAAARVALRQVGPVSVPVGAVVAIPAIRLSGLYLALATFGFGILVQRVGYPSSLLFGAAGRAPRDVALSQRA